MLFPRSNAPTPPLDACCIWLTFSLAHIALFSLSVCVSVTLWFPVSPPHFMPTLWHPVFLPPLTLAILLELLSSLQALPRYLYPPVALNYLWAPVWDLYHALWPFPQAGDVPVSASCRLSAHCRSSHPKLHILMVEPLLLYPSSFSVSTCSLTVWSPFFPGTTFWTLQSFTLLFLHFIHDSKTSARSCCLLLLYLDPSPSFSSSLLQGGP